MAGPPPSTGVRRIIGPSRAHGKARLVMFTGSVLQAGAALCGAVMIIELRGSAPVPYAVPVLAAAIAIYLPAAFLTSYGYTHLNPWRAVLLLPAAALVGFLVLALAVISGEVFGGGVSTRLEGEPEQKLDANFATTLITSDEAALVLGGVAAAPGETRGFGRSVSSCEVHRTDGRGYLELKIVQGPNVPRVFDRYRGGGDPVESLGDRAYLSKRRLVVLVADTIVELLVIGVKLDDARQVALVDVARTVVAQLRPPPPRGAAAGMVKPGQSPGS